MAVWTMNIYAGSFPLGLACWPKHCTSISARARKENKKSLMSMDLALGFQKKTHCQLSTNMLGVKISNKPLDTDVKM